MGNLLLSHDVISFLSVGIKDRGMSISSVLTLRRVWASVFILSMRYQGKFKPRESKISLS